MNGAGALRPSRRSAGPWSTIAPGVPCPARKNARESGTRAAGLPPQPVGDLAPTTVTRSVVGDLRALIE